MKGNIKYICNKQQYSYSCGMLPSEVANVMSASHKGLLLGDIVPRINMMTEWMATNVTVHVKTLCKSAIVISRYCPLEYEWNFFCFLFFFTEKVLLILF